MPLLEELIITTPGEPMLGTGNAFDKLNEAIRTFNDTFGGGAAGDILRKVDGTDFNFAIVTPKTGIDKNSNLNWTTVDIGDWNMDANDNKLVAHGLPNFKKIRSVHVVIRTDDDTQYYNLDYYNSFTDNICGGVQAFNQTAGYIGLARRNGEVFDAVGFDSTGFNRGWITIGYID